MKHTPTPWRVGRPGSVVADSEEGITINGATGPANVKYYGGNLIAESVSVANVEFIVLACNSFSELIHGLNEIRRRHVPMRGESKADPNRYCSVCVAPSSGRSKKFPCKTFTLANDALVVMEQYGRK